MRSPSVTGIMGFRYPLGEWLLSEAQPRDLERVLGWWHACEIIRGKTLSIYGNLYACCFTVMFLCIKAVADYAGILYRSSLTSENISHLLTHLLEFSNTKWCMCEGCLLVWGQLSTVLLLQLTERVFAFQNVKHKVVKTGNRKKTKEGFETSY